MASSGTLRGATTKCPATAVYEMDSWERQTLECTSGVQKENGMGPPLVCLLLVPIIVKVQAKYEPQGVALKA